MTSLARRSRPALPPGLIRLRWQAALAGGVGGRRAPLQPLHQRIGSQRQGPQKNPGRGCNAAGRSAWSDSRFRSLQPQCSCPASRQRGRWRRSARGGHRQDRPPFVGHAEASAYRPARCAGDARSSQSPVGTWASSRSIAADLARWRRLAPRAMPKSARCASNPCACGQCREDQYQRRGFGNLQRCAVEHHLAQGTRKRAATVV